MEQIKVNDFSAGWCPSDDAFSGRKNGLLRADGVSLDENGALILGNGTKKIDFQYPSPAHTIFSRLVCGERRRYVALENGSVYRNEDIIVNVGEGSLTRAAFGLFGDFVLITSGATKIKDICDFGIAELGLEPPDEAMDVQAIEVTLDAAWAGDLTTFSEPSGSSLTTGSFTASSTELALTTGTNTSFKAEMVSKVLSKNLSGGPNDIFEFKMKVDDVDKVISIRIRLKQFDGSWSHELVFGSVDLRAALDSGIYSTFRIKRSEFGSIGVDPDNWANIPEMDITVYSELADADAVFTFKDFILYDSELGPLEGTYEYVQVNVYRLGSFVSKSTAGPVSDAVTLSNGYTVLTPQDPTLISPATNEVWFYRRGGTLSDYYRVGTMLLSELGTFEDRMSDADALALGILLEDESIVVSEIDEDILEIVGPVHGRMLYFTAEEVFFSDIGNPDTYNPARTQSTVGSEGEKFLWARKVSENVVLVGTSFDIYTITGSWITYPDGVIDVEIRPLGLDCPPVCRDVAVYKGNVAYMSKNGWTLMGLSNDYISLVKPSLTLLHDEKIRYEYNGVPKLVLNDAWRYGICLTKEKLYCAVPTITDYTSEATRTDSETWERRLEIYNLFQKHWETRNFCPTIFELEEDGTILGFFDDVNELRILEYAHSKKLNFVEA